MIGQREIDFTTNEELMLTERIEAFLDMASNPEFGYSENGMKYVTGFIKNLFATNEIDVPDDILGDQVKRRKPIEKMLASLDSKTKRDLVRIIQLYKWINDFEELINSNTADEDDIKNEMLNIIKKINAGRENTRISNLLYIPFTLETAYDIEYSTGLHLLSSGTLRNLIINNRELDISTRVSFSREIMDKNPYEEVPTYIGKEGSVGSNYFETSVAPIDVVIEIESKEEEGMKVIVLESDYPFFLTKVEGVKLGETQPKDITNLSLGSELSANTTVAIQPSVDSRKESRSGYVFRFCCPFELKRAYVSVTFSNTESYVTEEVEVIDSYGVKIRSLNSVENLIYRRRISPIGQEETVKRLLNEEKEMTYRIVSAGKPLKWINIKNIKALQGGESEESLFVLRQINSESKIRDVEIYVDSYDPEEIIEYTISVSKDEMGKIIPMNYGKEGSRKIVYSENFPTALNLEIKIPRKDDYFPIVHSVICKVGELLL